MTCGYEVWTLTKADEDRLRVFERRVLRGTYGVVVIKYETWGIRNERENALIVGRSLQYRRS